MSFALYPDPPVHAVPVPAGVPVFTAFAALAAPDPRHDPPYAQVMFLRVAVLDAPITPRLLVAAGSGAAVEVSPDPQPVFSAAGDTGYLGDVSVTMVGPGVFDVMVGLVAPARAVGWRLGVAHTDAATRHVTWVVADAADDLAQPWVRPGPPAFRVSATIALGGAPSHIALDPSRRIAYVSNRADNSVWVIDIAERRTVTTVAVGQYPSTVVVDPAARTAYAASTRDSTITVIDTETHTVTATITAAAPDALAVDPQRRTLYAGCGSFEAGQIAIIDTDTRTATGMIPLPRRPFDLAVDPVTHKVYATDFIGAAMWELDPETMVLTPITVDKRTRGVAVDPVTHRVYASCPTEDTILIIDPATTAVTAVPAGHKPHGLAVDAAQYTVYAANDGEHTVSVIDTRSGALGAVRVGRPQGVAADLATHTAVSPADTAPGYVALLERVD